MLYRFLLTSFLGASLLIGQTTTNDTKPIQVTSLELVKAYADSPQSADSKYLGKIVHVTGIVIETGMSVYWTPNVRISDKKGGDIQAICVLPRLDVGKMSGFKPGQSVTFSGRVYRFTDNRVVIKECKAVK